MEIMKYTVEYYSVLGDHIFSRPEFTSQEYVTVESQEQLDQYIETKTDMWGHPYKVNLNYQNEESVSAKYNYISNQGGAIVRTYTEPVFKMV
jgi:hypothetical protein